MSVYVDDMKFPYKRGPRTLLMCHMIADSDEELHAMAANIGIRREWWEDPLTNSCSHYNISQSKRALAIQAGAIPITAKQAAAMNRRRKETGQLGSPSDAFTWYKKFREGELHP